MAKQLVLEARKSNHAFPDQATESAALIWEYPVFVTGMEFVQVMNLPIKEIRNFEACRNLRQLHITDCRIERISGLEYNTELRELYLCVKAEPDQVSSV